METTFPFLFVINSRFVRPPEVFSAVPLNNKTLAKALEELDKRLNMCVNDLKNSFNQSSLGEPKKNKAQEEHILYLQDQLSKLELDKIKLSERSEKQVTIIQKLKLNMEEESAQNKEQIAHLETEIKESLKDKKNFQKFVADQAEKVRDLEELLQEYEAENEDNISNRNLIKKVISRLRKLAKSSSSPPSGL